VKLTSTDHNLETVIDQRLGKAGNPVKAALLEKKQSHTVQAIIVDSNNLE